jgi:hypothetical protein
MLGLEAPCTNCSEPRVPWTRLPTERERARGYQGLRRRAGGINGGDFRENGEGDVRDQERRGAARHRGRGSLGAELLEVQEWVHAGVKLDFMTLLFSPETFEPIFELPSNTRVSCSDPYC